MIWKNYKYKEIDSKLVLFLSSDLHDVYVFLWHVKDCIQPMLDLICQSFIIDSSS